MTQRPQIAFTGAAAPKSGTLVVFTDEGLKLPPALEAVDGESMVAKAIKVAAFKGAKGNSMSLLTPSGTGLDRIVVMGIGERDKLQEFDWLKLGGKVQSLAASFGKVALLADTAAEEATADQLTALGQGALLSAYKFDTYKVKTKTKTPSKPLKLTIHGKAASAAKKAWPGVEGVADGVMLARDLVNEPANVLTPKAFAKEAEKLKKLGCDVDVLDEKDMKKLKMNALLGVAQGSRNAPRMAIIRWNGGKKSDKPIAFVGKGVTFDTGGISIKPSGGMEDMKGDMGGAAAVTGLMHALAARKAKANVVGIIGLVENMPDGNAQRPGDIVTSMSGQTIEIINTDAEGRLVLADCLWHCKEEFKPKFIVNLATLTGAILVALGKDHAGMFCNDDELAGKLFDAGQNTQEKLWRMPLGDAYDKLIDTKNADMKNTGGRLAGSITAAQFLKRYVDDTPWAHLDVAGTAMASPSTDINSSWASGFGVRLLDRLVRDNYEG
ncbi:MAG: leucyl aminopeptidase [Pseudomonadota bacterium]